MSVYIPGMEMPTSCLECFAFKSNASGQLFCKAKRIAFGKDDAKWLLKRTPNWCPLVPVPEHGRLIDADALAHDLDFDVENDQRALDEMNLVGKEREHLQFDKDCKQNCMWYLSESPTIIPADKEEE